MKIFQELNKMHIGLKTAILSLISLLPLYFIAIYIFKPELITRVSEEHSLFNDIDFLFILAICFSLSLMWFFMNFILSAFTTTFIEKITDDEWSDEAFYFVTYIYSVGYTCLFMLIGYSCNFTFMAFLKWTYSFVIFRILWVWIWTSIIANKSKA